VPPEQAQFLETRRFQIDEIARIFRVPPHMIGDLEKSSFNNIEQQSMEFVTYTLQPWICRWEQTMLNNLLTEVEQEKYFIKFNLGGLLRGDYDTRMRGYVAGIQNGFMSPNDCRSLEDFNLIASPAGGRYMVNGNKVDIEDIRKRWEGTGHA
jgi:HK97 family phage portal protein